MKPFTNVGAFRLTTILPVIPPAGAFFPPLTKAEGPPERTFR